MDQFNEFRFLAASCPATTFPIILGGTNAETAFTAFDDDNVGNIGIGGYTYDSGLLGTPLNEMQPIIAMITPASTYLWSKAIYQVGYMVLSLDGVLGVAITGDTSADGNFAYFGGYLFQGSIEQAHIQRADYTKYNVNTDTLTSDYSINLPTEITTVTQIRGIDSQSVELLYQDASGLGFKLMKINFQTLACSVQAITIFASNTNNIYSSKYLSNQGGYVFVGGYDNFGGGPTGIADQTFNVQEVKRLMKYLIKKQLLIQILLQFKVWLVLRAIILFLTVQQPLMQQPRILTQSTLTGTYMIGNSQTFTMTPYTIDCDLATLTQEIKFESSLSNSIFGTSTIYSIDNINYQFTLNTADTTYDGYTIIFSLTATVQETWQTASYNYEILIQQYTCDKVVITAQTIPDLTYFLSYGDGYVIADIQWPQTYEALCPYSSQILVTKIEDGLTYQTIQKIDISNPTHFQFTSNGLNSIGNYRVDINIYVSSLNDYTTNSGLKSRNIYSDTFMVQVTEEWKGYCLGEQKLNKLCLYCYTELFRFTFFQLFKLERYETRKFNIDLAIDLGEASEFAKFENFNLKFNPTQRNELKSYEIQYSVTSLSDNLSYIGVLKVDVGIYFRGNQTNLPSENIDVGSEGSVNNPRVKRIITARIISMSFRGIATIRFNDTLALNRDNVTHFYAISFDGIDLKLQLEFSYPEGVSQSSVIFQTESNLVFRYKMSLRFSMKMLWRMMNILQLIVNLPLMGFNLPSNVVLCFTQLVGITSLQFVDKDTVKSHFFNYLSSGKESNDYEMTISGLVLIVMFMMPFSTYAFLLMNEERLFERSFKKRFGSLYLGMRQQCPHLILNASMFYMKRLIYGLSVVFLLDLDIIQILFNLIIALGTLTTQIHYKPLDSRQGNNFEIFNELQYFTILTLILVLVGDIITDIEMRYTIGWIIVMMVINFIILNWGYLFVLMAFSIVKYSKIYYRRFLMMRAMKRKVKKMFDYQLQNQFESTLILNQLKKKQEQIPAVDIQVMEFSQSKPSNEIEQVDEVSLTLEEENDLNEQEMIAKTASGHFDQRQNSLSPSQLSMTPRNPNSIGTQFRKSQSPQQMTSLKYQKARSHRLSNKKLTDSTKNFMKQESLPISEKPISMQNGIFVSSKTQAKSKQFGISLVQNHMQRNNYIDTLGSDDQLTGRHKNQEEEKMSYQHQFSYFSKASNGSNNVSPGLPHRQPSILMSSQVNLAPVFRDEKKTDENRLDELKKRLAKYNLEKV
ncbi:UNKNOWN [Stylonychia lemnae]|uniref:TRP C-terminal domain-containing protein n=1 Tax=Stylonychia lemnae TaxID=5949 RepID=A0A077ZVH9_STYLE|nr:UNKNOWN [Stylonychia lemnae]|eukprot:CDW73290.1 UNKNOWN [Stylonychia lemnae]